MLNVGINLLTAHPEGIGLLTNLEELEMNSTQLAAITSFNESLHQLHILIANSNRISTLADELAGVGCS